MVVNPLITPPVMLNQGKPSFSLSVWPFAGGSFPSAVLAVARLPQCGRCSTVVTGMGPGDPGTPRKVLTPLWCAFGDGVFPQASAYPKLSSKCLLVIRALRLSVQGWRGMHAIVSRSAALSFGSHYTLPGNNAIKSEARKQKSECSLEAIGT